MCLARRGSGVKGEAALGGETARHVASHATNDREAIETPSPLPARAWGGGTGRSFRQLAATSLLIDRANRRNHGAYEAASGFTRGVSMGFPGGGLGVTFDGTGQIVVADDGSSFTQGW